MKKTALFNLHSELGGRMVSFAGWSMPVEYGSIVREHTAVREGTGIFDVSHMGELILRGADAHAALEYLISNRVPPVSAKRAVYSGLLNEQGGFVDDVIVGLIGDETAIMVVNAANEEKDEAWVRTVLEREGQARGWDVRMENESANWGLLAVQGKTALAAVAAILRGFVEQPPFSILPMTYEGADIIVMMTGYTGEPGVEILVPPAQSESLFRAFVTHGAVPCGLGARDSLRLEKGYSLYGHEITDETHAWEAGLGWTVKMDKDDFSGKQALEAIQSDPAKKNFRKLRGILPEGKTPIRAGAELFSVTDETMSLGHITSGLWSPSLGKPIALGYVRGTYTEDHILISLRGRMLRGSLTKRVFV